MRLIKPNANAGKHATCTTSSCLQEGRLRKHHEMGRLCFSSFGTTLRQWSMFIDWQDKSRSQITILHAHRVESHSSQTAGLPSNKAEGFANKCSSTRRGFQQSRRWWVKGMGWKLRPTNQVKQKHQTYTQRSKATQTPMQEKLQLTNATHDRIGRGDLYRLNFTSLRTSKQRQFVFVNV